MSAVATTSAAPLEQPVAVHPAESLGTSLYQAQAAEQKRWMIWFGVPALVASLFVGVTFATGDAWWLGLAITAIVLDIMVLVWLAMSSDTNGVIGDSPAH